MVRGADVMPSKMEEGKLVLLNGNSKIKVDVEGGQRGMKLLSLLLLTPQYAVLILLMRHVRTRPGPKFTTSTTVPLAEVFKTVACLLIIFFQQGGPRGWINHLHEFLISRPVDFAKVCIPSLLFVLQNNLVFVAISNLDAATFQVTYQLKILTTAIFSVVLLGKRLSVAQWFALFLLFAGVSIIQVKEALARQLPGASSVSTPPSPPSWAVANSSSSSSSGDGDVLGTSKGHEQSYVIGMVSVLVCSILSGFANVFFEVLLKGGKQSVWMRNVQLGLSGSVLGGLACLGHDGVIIDKQGFLFGYDALVWTVVMLQALGGLLVAAVIKYADNILKGFSTAGSILLSCVASVYLFDFKMDALFMLGTTLVVVAVYVYSTYPATQRDQDLQLTVPEPAALEEMKSLILSQMEKEEEEEKDAEVR